MNEKQIRARERLANEDDATYLERMNMLEQLEHDDYMRESKEYRQAVEVAQTTPSVIAAHAEYQKCLAREVERIMAQQHEQRHP